MWMQKKYMEKNKNESRREVQCRHKIGGNWKEINENAEKRKGKQT
jgi:hypothetical protein